MTLYCPAMVAVQIVVVVYLRKQQVPLLLLEVAVLLCVADLVELPLVGQAKHLQASPIPCQLPHLLRCLPPKTLVNSLTN